ncbi:hypothetical protein [Mucilaginibacter sp. CSA2-8R]|uniref:hypothetical protein n=1 Tax=Mucilaginibacter sp. CSA2-8R TaxID=3141542 RepID=UPI00315D5750
MKKLLLFLILFQLSTFVSQAQDCGQFPAGTVCSQSPSGQQANCCRCIGGALQNRNFCSAAPINKGLIFLIIVGLGIGSFLLKTQIGENKELIS